MIKENFILLFQIDVNLFNGVLNVSSCKFNTPAYVSYPHFYQADPALIEMFQCSVCFWFSFHQSVSLQWILSTLKCSSVICELWPL